MNYQEGQVSCIPQLKSPRLREIDLRQDGRGILAEIDEWETPFSALYQAAVVRELSLLPSGRNNIDLADVAASTGRFVPESIKGKMVEERG